MIRYRIKIHCSGQPLISGTLADRPCIIGRAPDSDFVLKEDSVSRRHARLYLRDNVVHIEDLDSSNGVLLNGSRVRDAVVSPSDRIRVGSYTIRVEPVTGTFEESHRNRTELDYADVGQIHERLVDEDHPSLSFLYRLSQRMSRERALRPLLGTLLDEVMTGFPAQRGFVLVRNAPDQGGDVWVSRSKASVETAPPISQTLIDHVFKTRSSVLTSDACLDERFENADSVVAHQIKAVMCTPLTSHERVFGVIYIDADSTPMPFKRGDLQLLSIVGQVAGAAVENMDLIQKQIHQERLAAIGQTVSATSHDMRNILTGLTGGSEILAQAREQQNWDRVANGLRIIQRSVGRFEGLLDSLLTYARKTEVTLQETEVGPLIQEVLESIAPEAEKHGVTLEFKNSLPHPINLDPQQIHRVLLNLLKNALDATADRGGAIRVEAYSDDNANLIRVSDTGPGIAPEHLPRLGQAFFTTKENRGTGLGLAVCYRIMEQHEGTVRVDSRVGEGTAFTLVFPDRCRTTARFRAYGS